MELYVSTGGDSTAVYDESIDLRAIGDISIRRASHVEPDEQGKWSADLQPIGGPRIGPFLTRSAALAAEAAWLNAYFENTHGETPK